MGKIQHQDYDNTSLNPLTPNSTKITIDKSGRNRRSKVSIDIESNLNDTYFDEDFEAAVNKLDSSEKICTCGRWYDEDQAELRQSLKENHTNTGYEKYFSWGYDWVEDNEGGFWCCPDAKMTLNIAPTELQKMKKQKFRHWWANRRYRKRHKKDILQAFCNSRHVSDAAKAFARHPNLYAYIGGGGSFPDFGKDCPVHGIENRRSLENMSSNIKARVIRSRGGGVINAPQYWPNDQFRCGARRSRMLEAARATKNVQKKSEDWFCTKPGKQAMEELKQEDNKTYTEIVKIRDLYTY